uniref:Uncharacterized protein n=2 Tax=Ixodes scapularis TaxID=6945 RepID=A0A1S4LJB2_IXOSC
GGFRGVVWTDCLQAVVLMLAPATIVIKVIYDASFDAIQLRPVGDFDVRPYSQSRPDQRRKFVELPDWTICNGTLWNWYQPGSCSKIFGCKKPERCSKVNLLLL